MPNRSHSPGAPLQLDDFARDLGECFEVRSEGGSVTLELKEASAAGPRTLRPAGRQAFTLVFQGPPAPVLPQRIYRLEHPAWEGLDLFLVPVGASEAGICYEAVFN